MRRCVILLIWLTLAVLAKADNVIAKVDLLRVERVHIFLSPLDAIGPISTTKEMLAQNPKFEIIIRHDWRGMMSDRMLELSKASYEKADVNIRHDLKFLIVMSDRDGGVVMNLAMEGFSSKGLLNDVSVRFDDAFAQRIHDYIHAVTSPATKR